MEFSLDQRAVQAIFDVPDVHGTFSAEQAAYLREIGAKRRCVFMAFPPKAAGTFLREAVIYATGGDLVRTVHAQGGRDAQPYLPTFIAYYHGGICPGVMVTHNHMQALPANMRFLEAFNIRPIVMVRSIPDMLASFSDMLDTDPAARVLGLNAPVPDWLNMGAQAKSDYLIDVLGPWYVGYYASWLGYAAQAPERVNVLNYASVVREPAATLLCMLWHSEIPTTIEVCQRAIDQAWAVKSTLRFNKGEKDRGRDYFTGYQLGRLQTMLDLYDIPDEYLPELLNWLAPR